jgi:TPR repeat protein
MVPAMKALFHIYWSGNGATSDPVKAVHWIKRAAELGDAPAQVLLGRIYLFEGEFEEVQPAKAKEWFVKAAMSGNQDALALAGHASLFGDGKTRSENDVIDAMAWYEMSLDVDPEVKEKLEMVKSQCPQLVKAGRAKALELRKLIQR